MFQCTLKEECSFVGVGVHCANQSNIVIKPAEENSGIRFIRSDISDVDNTIIANYTNVKSAVMCTQISNKYGVSAFTIEHIMSALSGLNITNADILMDTDEIPILDGSSACFVEKFLNVGIKTQSARRKILKIKKCISVDTPNKKITIKPAESFSANISFDFISKGLITAPFSFNENTSSYVEEIAKARTFGFYEDVQYLMDHNMAKGASMLNTVVFNFSGEPLNPEGMRYHDEPVRHKMLDLIGDLSLSEYKIIGEVNAYCTGHQLNNNLMFEIFKDENNYEIF